jgi:hypothetical protein
MEWWKGACLSGVGEGDGERLETLGLDDRSDVRWRLQSSCRALDADLPDAGGAGCHGAPAGDRLPCSRTEPRIILEPPEEYVSIEQEAHGHE